MRRNSVFVPAENDNRLPGIPRIAVKAPFQRRPLIHNKAVFPFSQDKKTALF
jgi:hypothetical protein